MLLIRILIGQPETGQKNTPGIKPYRQKISRLILELCSDPPAKGFRHISLSALSKTDCDFIIHFPILSFMTLFHKLFHSTILQKKLQFVSNKSCRFAIYQPLKRQLSSQPYIYFEFLFPFLTLILRIILRIRNTTSTMITIKIRQIPAIIAENLLGCFTRSMIFLLSSTTLRPCVVS